MSAGPEIEAATTAALDAAQAWVRRQPDGTPSAYDLILYLGLLFGERREEQLEVLAVVAKGGDASYAMLTLAAASYRHEAMGDLLLQAFGPAGDPRRLALRQACRRWLS
ncbi:MAG: hypothetical protein Q7U73_04960 [Rubrivivax sp.]|nr:hypothetical protein [Rubrivivax sp.]